MKKLLQLFFIFFISISVWKCQLLKEPAAKVMSTSLNTAEIDTVSNNLPLANYKLQVKDTSGKIINMEDYKGKVIFLNFWATWCLPCVAELPSINKLYNKLKEENIAFLLISDEPIDKVKKYQQKKGYTVPFHIIDQEGVIPIMYQSQSIPTTFIINKKGQIVKAGTGAENWNDDEFIETIIRML